MREKYPEPKFSPLMEGTVTVQPGSPLVLTDKDTTRQLSEEQELKLRQLGSALKVYLTTAKDLLEGRYRDLHEFAPPHLTGACLPTIFVLNDGIILRYDLVPNPKLQGRVGFMNGTLESFAPVLSERVVHCPADPTNYDPGPDGVNIGMFKQNPTTGQRSEILTARILIFAASKLAAGDQVRFSTERPIPIVSVQNEFDLQIHGELAPAPTSPQGDKRQRFIARSRMKLPVGWQAFEIYPPYDGGVWKPELAAHWAEADLLAAVVRRNLRDAEFRALDPNAAARKQFSSLLKQLGSLLEGPEEPMHQFLKEHPELLSPAHVKYWSKLPLGRHETDFVFQEPATDYLFIELESPLREIFRKDGQPREELIHAIDQVTGWQRYIEDNLITLQREHHLDGLSSSPRYLIVIGRSASLNDENRRKMVTMANMVPKLKIVTYDDLVANSKSVGENLLGPLLEMGENVEVYYLPSK